MFPLSPTTIQKRRNQLVELSGVKRIRIHDFRHSTATLLTNNGASINLVSKYLGHDNISTTLNTYSHLFKNQFNDIINQFNKLETEEKVHN